MGACVLCKEQITNPLGPQRLVEQITTWLGEESPNLIPEFVNCADEMLELRDELNQSTDYCVITKAPMNVCAYCFTEHIYHWLTTTNSSLIANYITFFNFDITNQGIVKEARKEGYVQ